MSGQVIEKLTLKELERVLLKHGYNLKILAEEKGHGGTYFFPVTFTIPTIADSTINCFLYYSDEDGKSDNDNIKDFVLNAFFPSKSVISAEVLNEINRQPIRGRISIQLIDDIAYSQWISIFGGVTETYIENQLKRFDVAVGQCIEYIHSAEEGVEKLRRELGDIFKPGKK